MAQDIENALLLRMETTLRKLERDMEKGRATVRRTTTQMQADFDRTGRSILNMSSRGRFVVQNVSNQLGDMAVQLQGGTAASRVMAQQLPQLFGGFGVLGGVLGTVTPLLGTLAAVGIPVGAALFAMGRGAKETAAELEKVDGLDLDGARSAIESLVGLQEKYIAALRVAAETRSASSIAAVNAIGKEYEAQKALLQLKKVETGINLENMRAALEQQRNDLRSFLQEIKAEAEATINVTPGDPEGLRRRNRAVAEAIAEAAVEQRELTNSIQIYEAKIAIAELAMDALTDATANAADFSATLESADLASPINTAASAAEALAANLAESVAQLNKIVAAARAGLTSSRQALEIARAKQTYGDDTVGLAGQEAVINSRYGYQDGGYSMIARGRAADLAAAERDVRRYAEESARIEAQVKAIEDGLDTSGGRRRSRGGSGADTVEQLTAKYEALRGQLDPTFRSLQQLRDAQTTLTEAYSAGLITQDQFNELLRKAEDQFGQTASVMQTYAAQLGDILGDLAVMTLDNIDDVDALKKAWADFARQTARELLKLAISKGFQALINLATGGIGGNLFGGIGGGGGGIGFRASGGPVSAGKPYIVGEKRPELFVPNTSGTILPSVPSGGAAEFNVNIIGNLPSGAVRRGNGRVDIDMARLVNSVIENGGADSGMRARFGASPRGSGA